MKSFSQNSVLVAIFSGQEVNRGVRFIFKPILPIFMKLAQERYEGPIKQQPLDAFAEALYSKRYQDAQRLFVDNPHDIGPALYNRFLEHEPRIYPTRHYEPILFQRSVSDFHLADANRRYTSNPEAVGRFLREYFGQIAVAMENFEQLSRKFPDIGKIVEGIIKGKPEDRQHLEVFLAFSN